MPPPAVFYTITNATGFSQTVLQADFNAGTHGNAPNEVWWKYEPASDGILGLFCNKGGTFVPRLQLFKTDALTALRNNVDSAYWYQVEGGVRYWIVVLRQPAGASNFDFTLFADTAVLNPTLDPGDIIINDDENASPDGHSYAAAVFTSAGVFKGFKTGIPGGEIGDSVPDGTQLWHDRYAQHGSPLALFSAAGSFTVGLDTTPTLGSVFPNIYGHPDGIFYVVNRNGADAGKVYTVTSGVVSGLLADVNAAVFVSSVSNDGTILYYVLDSGPNTEQIHRWDLVNDLPLSDLYTVSELVTDTGLIASTAVNGHPGEILVLADDSIITYYQNVTQSKSVLLHIADDGTLLHSYSYPWGSGPRIDHISWDPQNPTYIRIWFFIDAAARNGRIGRLTIATGALTTFDTPLFASGINQNTANSQMFGPSSSCTLVTAKRSSALDAETDTGTGDESGGTSTIPTCCDEGGPTGGGDTGTNPDPVGTLPPWMASCTGGGLVDGVADLADGESWL